MSASTPAHYDLVIVGGGPVGLAAAAAGARRGHSVLVLEQFEILHERGSSGGAERQWRLQYAQEDLARLTVETVPLWTELERAGGRRLVHRTGSLWFGDTATSTNEGQVNAAVEVLDRVGLPYDWLTAKEIEQRYRFARLPRHYEGFFQPDGGMVDVRATLWLLFEQARAAGARIRDHERVLELEPDDNGVTVRSEHGVYRADHLVLATGAFANPLLQPLGIDLEVELYEMTTAYFRTTDPGFDYPTWFAFQPPADEDTNLFYGFGRLPWAPGDLARVAPDFEVDGFEDPYRSGRAADPDHVKRTAAWVAEHLPALDPTPVQPGSCLIALPKDPARQFYFGHAPDGVPGAGRMVIHSAGWGFKYVPLLGRACVELALDGRTSHDLSRFSL
ncbi:FAD-dependent oxidoreductase [Kitasatospora sp. NPDC056138]|uniref:FAD-dependent oxidoreductase n=1 Tax=Kitasatospora sp. NPDC056138 TaxID=3345724 RepID=UPI0035E0B692